MELKEVADSLAVKSDVCLLKSNDLVEKYCKDEESYNRFLKIFSNAFSRRRMYPLLASFKYREIESVIENGQQFTSCDNEMYEADILREIYKNEHQTDLDIRGDDHGQAISLFNESIGAHKVKKDLSSYGEKMRKMSECADIYLNSDGEFSKEKISEFFNVLYSSDEIAEYPHRFGAMLKNYCANNPRLSLCCNNNFLYLVNYLIHSHPDCCDKDLIDFTKEVIDISTTKEELAFENFSVTDYIRLSKFTLQNIDKLEKKRNDLEPSKRKFLGFFKK